MTRSPDPNEEAVRGFAVTVHPDVLALLDAGVPNRSYARVTSPVRPISSWRRILARTAIGLALIFLTTFGIKYFGKTEWTKKSPVVETVVQLPSKVSKPALAVSSPPAFDTSNLKPSQATIKALENSWVSATADGKEALGKLLVKDEISVIGFSKKVLLRVGNAGGVEVTLDGKPIGLIGRRGMVRLVELTPDGFRILSASNGQPTPQDSAPTFELRAASEIGTAFAKPQR